MNDTDLYKICKYPFLNESKEYIKDSGISFNDLLEDSISTIIDLGKRRVKDALNGKIHRYDSDSPYLEIMSYPVTNIILSCINDTGLIKRYAVFESKRVYEELKKEDDSYIMKIAAHFSLIPKKDEKKYGIHFTDYLSSSTKINDPKWMLVNRKLSGGWIFLEKDDFVRLLIERYREDIENTLPLKIDKEDCKKIISRVGDIITELKDKKIEYNRQNIGKVKPDCFPPCVKEIIRKTEEGLNLSHHERFTLTTFLHKIGVEKDEIIQLFKNMPDFDFKLTKYQVDNITGEDSGTVYRCPSCSTMKTYGICTKSVKERYKDCNNVFNPIKKYKLELDKKYNKIKLIGTNH